MGLVVKSFASPEQTNTFPNGDERVLELAGKPVGLATFEPGWRWSNDIRPLVGTDTCQAHHIGYVVAGRLHVETPDGDAIDLGPGDVFDLPPGHDGWVVGDEPVLMLDWGEKIRDYARRADETAGAAR
jgi:hypothetical protein